jgi:hypothetical protein
MKKSRRSSDIFELMAQIDHVAKRSENQALMQWVADHRVQACRSLRQPDKGLVPHLLDAIMRDGCPLLIDTLVICSSC